MNDIYKLSKDVRIRKEGDQYILINIATQGLHFISETAYSIVEKIDGQKSIDKIIDELFSSSDCEKERDSVIHDFIDKLVERKLLIKET